MQNLQKVFLFIVLLYSRIILLGIFRNAKWR